MIDKRCIDMKKKKIYIKYGIKHYLSFAFSVMSAVCYLITSVSYQLNNYVYKISLCDIVTSQGLNFEANIISIPNIIKLALLIGFILNLSGLILLFIHKYSYSSMFFILSALSPIFFILSNSIISKDVIYLNINTFKVTYYIPIFAIIVLEILSAVFSRWSLGTEALGESIFKIFSYISIGAVIIITFYIFSSGLPALVTINPFSFLLGTTWSPSENLYGISPLILSSIAVTLGSITLGVPIGIFTAVFLSEISSPKLATIIRTSVQLLAGIPSVLYGFFGMIVIVPFIKRIFNGKTFGDSLLAAIIILSIMILPTIISISENALRAVPNYLREASLALGATSIKTIFKVTIPSAASGLVSAVILGIGRAIGETMAVIMVAGNVANMPSLLKPARFLTTGIVLEMSYSSGLHRQALFSIGLILFIFIMIIDICFICTSKKGRLQV